MFKKILPYLITAVLGIAITVIIICVNHIWERESAQGVMQILSDAFLIPGVIIGGVGLLVFASNGGAYDMLGYAMLMFFNLFRRDVNKRKYKDFYEYRQSKKDRKHGFAFMLIVGVVFIAVAVVFLILYYNV